MTQFFIELIRKMVESTPNDAELGKKIRQLYHDQLKK